MSSEFTIRPARLEDAASLQHLAAQTFFETYPDLTDREAENYIDSEFPLVKLKTELTDETVLFLVAHSTDLVGYTQFARGQAPPEINAVTPVELVRLFIRRAAQGRHLGSDLLEEGIRWGARSNSDVIWLKVWDQNPKAINFYRRRGFVIVGETRYTNGGMNDRVLLMAKSI